jgi:hypothetical protein
VGGFVAHGLAPSVGEAAVLGLDANRHDARTRARKGETRRGITRLQAAPSRPKIGDTALRAKPLP